ncbi:unnamed protein product [Absidia cylindrospora]
MASRSFVAGEIKSYHQVMEVNGDKFHSTWYATSKRQSGSNAVDSTIFRSLDGKHFYGKLLFFCTASIEGNEVMLAGLVPLNNVKYPVLNDNDPRNECRIHATWDHLSGIIQQLVFVDVAQVIDQFGLLDDCKNPVLKNLITPVEGIWRVCFLGQNEIRML